MCSRAVMCTSDWADPGRVHCRWLTWRLRVAHLRYTHTVCPATSALIRPPPPSRNSSSCRSSIRERYSHSRARPHRDTFDLFLASFTPHAVYTRSVQYIALSTYVFIPMRTCACMDMYMSCIYSCIHIFAYVRVYVFYVRVSR